MTDRHPDILTVRYAEVLRRLRRVVDAGNYYKSFTADDVVHVATHWLTPRKAVVVPLRVVIEAAADIGPVDDDARPVELTPYQAAVVRELCREGGSNADIADVLGIGEESIKTHLKCAYAAVGARDRAQLIALVLGGKVRIVAKGSNRKKAS